MKTFQEMFGKSSVIEKNRSRFITFSDQYVCFYISFKQLLNIFHLKKVYVECRPFEATNFGNNIHVIGKQGKSFYSCSIILKAVQIISETIRSESGMVLIPTYVSITKIDSKTHHWNFRLLILTHFLLIYQVIEALYSLHL